MFRPGRRVSRLTAIRRKSLLERVTTRGSTSVCPTKPDREKSSRRRRGGEGNVDVSEEATRKGATERKMAVDAGGRMQRGRMRDMGVRRRIADGAVFSNSS